MPQLAISTHSQARHAFQDSGHHLTDQSETSSSETDEMLRAVEAYEQESSLIGVGLVILAIQARQRQLGWTDVEFRDAVGTPPEQVFDFIRCREMLPLTLIDALSRALTLPESFFSGPI